MDGNLEVQPCGRYSTMQCVYFCDYPLRLNRACMSPRFPPCPPQVDATSVTGPEG